MVDLTDKYVTMSRELSRLGHRYNPNFLFLKYELENPEYTFLLLQGATRSGKTYSAVQNIWSIHEEHKGVKTNIVRQYTNQLKTTVLEDFKDIGIAANLFDDKNLNRSVPITYSHNEGSINFVAGENELSLKGLKGNLLYINEGDQLGWASVRELLNRNTGKVIIDYNPVGGFAKTWIKTEIMPRAKVAMIRTTIFDNPYAPRATLDNLESMRETNPEYYKRMALGMEIADEGQIYSHFRRMEDADYPKDADIFVVDFGFAEPTAIIQGKVDDAIRRAWIREILYRKETDAIGILVALFFAGFDNNRHFCITDNGDRAAINQMRNGVDLTEDFLIQRASDMRFEVHKGSVTSKRLRDFVAGGVDVQPTKNKNIEGGILLVNQFDISVTDGSSNIWREVASYKRKEDRQTGRFDGEPPDTDNHTMDCIRYLIAKYKSCMPLH